MNSVSVLLPQVSRKSIISGLVVALSIASGYSLVCDEAVAEGPPLSCRNLASAPTTPATGKPQGDTSVKTVGGGEALHRGVYEVELKATPGFRNPFFNVQLQVTFRRPDGSEVTVDGFYDGEDLFRARAYCDTLGTWRWRSASNNAGLANKTGSFRVVPSQLKGKLKRHPQDSRQLAYDNGEWFLHIGDTAYRYPVSTEPKWQEYFDQAVQMGATKLRTWFCQERSVQVLFSDDRKALNLTYWQEIDRRYTYALESHPEVMFQVIIYGEDWEELERYDKGDPVSRLPAQYAQARFSSFPNIYWCISNDLTITKYNGPARRRVRRDVISKIGRDVAAREPWQTLLTNHQRRFTGYAFEYEPWSDVITLEDLDQAWGLTVLHYWDKQADPVVLDEDRYEHYRNPKHDRYFFRRLMWANLLSGGAATYGGLMTYEPYDGNLQGMQGYFDAVRAGKLEDGAHDFPYIRKFFQDSGLTLVGMVPDDGVASGLAEHRQRGEATPEVRRQFKCIHNGSTFIVYLANPTGWDPETDNVADAVPSVTLLLPTGSFHARWFNPSTGDWQDGGTVGGENQKLTAPGTGDWILLLRTRGQSQTI